MSVSAISSTTSTIAYAPAAAATATAAAAVEETNTVAEDQAVSENGSRWGRTRHTHRHVQRHMRHLDREVRHAVSAAVKEAEGLDKEAVGEIRDLAKEFRNDLRDLFHEAGRGHDFDPQAVLTGIADAARELADGLLALRDRFSAGTVEEPAEEPAEVPLVVPEDAEDGKVADEPTMSISVLA